MPTKGRARVAAEEPGYANMADVAREAGVSIGTVSRALNGRPGVSEANRERIRTIAAGLSYVVSPEASGLARRTTHRVGVVVPNIWGWFYARMLAGIEGVLRRAELDVLLYHVEGREDRDQFFERLPTRRKVDAVIVVAFPVTEAQIGRLGLMGVHVVVAGGRLGSYPHVRIDDPLVGRTAVEHLVGLGHRRIAMIRSRDNESVSWPADDERAAGYRAGLVAGGIEPQPELVATEAWGVEGGRQAMRRLLALPEPPTGVFAFSDEMAYGALHQLRTAGLDAPEHMSVVGVDDHPMAELHDLTTIRQPVLEQGAAAAQTALALLRGGRVDDPALCMPTELVVRGSTGPAPA